MYSSSNVSVDKGGVSVELNENFLKLRTERVVVVSNVHVLLVSELLGSLGTAPRGKVENKRSLSLTRGRGMSFSRYSSVAAATANHTRRKKRIDHFICMLERKYSHSAWQCGRCALAIVRSVSLSIDVTLPPPGI
jgi:hypothetical protein